MGKLTEEVFNESCCDGGKGGNTTSYLINNKMGPSEGEARDLLEENVIEPSKPSNPKDMVGSNKIPYHLWPNTATALGSLACLEGNLKYGRTNWRAAGVKASIYYDACIRHLNAWFDEGEEEDPDSGLPHLAHALACIAIIVDAKAAGKLTDDRLIRGGYRRFIDAITPHVKRLKEKHADKNPRHFYIQDSEKRTSD